jgi:phage terminase large subunit
VIDVVEVGAGVHDRLLELGLPVNPYQAGEAPFDRNGLSTLEPRITGTCVNASGREDRHRRARRQARAPLGSIKWTVDSRDRIKVESKDDMRKRGMPSPDRADTIAMAFSRRGQGGRPIDIESHAEESITGG